MDKRAQGLPITTVILAILGIVVLVILFAIMTGRLTIFAGAANECPGVCVVAGPSPAAPVSGVLEIGDKCDDVTQTRLLGSYIARGLRDDKGKPIVCGKCCQQLA